MRIVLAVVLALAAGAARVWAQTPTPDPATIMQDCIKVLSPDRPNETGAGAPAIRIVSPVSGATIRSAEEPFAAVEFVVETTNFDLPGTAEDEAQRHWHLWLNNGVWGMYYQNTVVAHLPYGTWRVCAVMSDAQHVDLGMPDAILLKVEREGAGGGTPAAAVAVIVGVALAGVGYWLGRRAALAGKG